MIYRLYIEMNLLILFGKHLYGDGGLDWIAQSRCEVAIDQMRKNPYCDLIITGGKTNFSDKSEASEMKNYIVQAIGSDRKILLEEEGLTTINQLYILKTKYLIPNHWEEICLISDQIHIKRLEIIARHLFGADFKLRFIGAEVKLSGHYRKAIEENEKRLLELISENPVLKTFPLGDHESWNRFDQFYRQKKSETNSDRLDLIDINDQFPNFYQQYGDAK